MAEIKEWTEAVEDGMKIVRVSYTWKLADVPTWVDQSAFSGVRGMIEPADGVLKPATVWCFRGYLWDRFLLSHDKFFLEKTDGYMEGDHQWILTVKKER